MSSRKFARLLEKKGVHFVRQRGTSHAIYERVAEGITRRAPVVMGKSELSPKYIKLVLRQLGFSDVEIDGMFKR
ncbi:MAG: type II toxin-antitoxin system HicA family toxin [Anaerolineae bacterium]|nr:type II toxin-antitoxin system HicA family toxin [Anaerolineae bacterium]